MSNSVEASLSPRERVMFEFLRDNGTATSEQLGKALEVANLGSAGGPHALVVMVKYLTAKLAPSGYIIERTSGSLGRGNKSAYSMEKKF